jgi:putative ABC transport system permease protein
MNALINDIKFSLRQLVKSPGFTGVAVLTLTIGIGANITMFGFINSWFLRPLPFDNHERLMAVQELDRISGREKSIKLANFLDWKERNQTFDELAAYRDMDATLIHAGVAERLTGMQVSASLLSMLDIKPMKGRLFEDSDDQAGSQRTVILGQGLWQRCFGGSPGVIGQSVVLNEQPYTVVGILPASFMFPPFRKQQVDFWISFGPWVAENPFVLDRGITMGTKGIGLLKSDISPTQARADLDAIARQLERAYPEDNKDRGAFVEPFQSHVVASTKSMMLLLMGTVVFVLLIVCVNIANMFLVRFMHRKREFSLRSALGAGRWRIVRQLSCESLVLAVVGGIGGIIVASWGHTLINSVLAGRLHYQVDSLLQMDTTIWLFTLGIALGSALIFGLLPALQSSKTYPAASLSKSTSRTTCDTSQHRLRDVLIITEIALSLILLVGGGLLLRSFVNVMESDPGYAPENALVMTLSVPKEINQNDRRKSTLYQQLQQEIGSLPGVNYAGIAANMMGRGTLGYYVEGTPVPDPGSISDASIVWASPDFHQAMGMRLLRGRFFSEHDNRDSGRLVAIVDRTFARKWWPHEDPIGKRFQMNGRPVEGAPWFEIVGVVGQSKHYGVDKPLREFVFLSAFQTTQSYGDEMTLVVRGQGDLMGLADPIRQTVARANPDIPVLDIRPLAAIASDQVFPRRLTTGVLGLFAMTALLLAVLGIHGVMAFSVSRRTNEIGIRMALGAESRDILRLILRKGMALMALGIAVGLMGSLVLVRLVKSFLFGVTAYDPITFLLVIAVLATAALFACYIPAQRATKIDPMEALRCE